MVSGSAVVVLTYSIALVVKKQSDDADGRQPPASVAVREVKRRQHRLVEDVKRVVAFDDRAGAERRFVPGRIRAAGDVVSERRPARASCSICRTR